MKRPIPEGVIAPEGCTILGWGGEFKETERGFRGWFRTEKHDNWFPCSMTEGNQTKLIYAAPADSEVARLNYPEIPESSQTTNPPQISTSAVGDGVIRAIIANWRQRAQSPHLPENFRNGIEACADELEALL